MRVVFDTNTVISALLFGGTLRWLVAHWQSGRVTPVVSHATAAEFLRVLAYPKFGLTEADIEVVAARYLPFAERVEWTEAPPNVPECRDSHDQKFLDLAVMSGAEVLVTGDADVLALRAQAAFAIETPAQHQQRFAES
jgi:putative PIN family toxin of toxin-antitoxin system